MKKQLSLLFLKGKTVFFITAVKRNIFCCNACPVYNAAVGMNIGLVLSGFKMWMDLSSRRHSFISFIYYAFC